MTSFNPRPTLPAPLDAWVAIVDDHESVRSSLARALRFEGIHTRVFASAEEFLEHPMPTPPTCLVLDMQLPGMSGHELAHFLERDGRPRSPIVFITAHDDLLASLDSCCAPRGCLRKPFDIDALLALVRPLIAATATSVNVR